MIYNIEVGHSFLESLLNGYLIHYPLSEIPIADTRIFLPNKRSCRELLKLFISVGIPSEELPKIETIGQFSSEDEALILPYVSNATIISPLALRVIIAKLLQKKFSFYHTHSKEAFNLATSLESLYLELVKEEVSFENVKRMFISELDGVNNKILDYLFIILEDLPCYLKENNLVDPITYRYNSLNFIGELWQKLKPVFPIIVGAPNEFSASIYKFLAIINKLERGNIVIKNFLSQTLPFSNFHFRRTHQELFDKLNVESVNCRTWNYHSFDKSLNSDFVEKLFQEDIFVSELSEKESCNFTTNIELVSCKNEFEMASAISACLKQQLAQNHISILVTRDYELRRKVKIHLTKWNININDSSGIEINRTALGSFLQLCLQLIKENFSGLALLSLLKHPYSGLGYKRSDLRKKTRNFELEERRHNIFRTSSVEEKNIIKAQLTEISKKLSSLLKHTSSLKAIVQEHLHFAYQVTIIATDDNEEKPILWYGEEGKQVQEFFDELLKHLEVYETIEGRNYYEIYNNLISNQIIRKAINIENKIHILTPEEAYSLNPDHIILADSKEIESLSSLWLNLKLREKLHLKTSDKMIRENNEIMFNLLSSKRISFFYSKQKQGQASVESKLLLRVKTLLKKFDIESKIHISYIDSLQFIPEEEMIPPAPYSKLLVNIVTVTQIQKLMQDPYAFYAEEILKLKKIEELYKDSLLLEFGIFVHKVINLALLNPQQDELEQQIINIATIELKKLPLERYLLEIWLYRVKRIAKFLADNFILDGKILSEIKGIHSLDNSFLLEAKADLIIESKEAIKIIDFKTGTVPSYKFIEYGLYPQLALEALIAEKEGFKEIAKFHLKKELIYIKVTGRDPAGEITTLKNTDILIRKAEQGITSLLELFSSGKQSLISSPYYDNNIFSKDYLHLSRLKEWN